MSSAAGYFEMAARSRRVGLISNPNSGRNHHQHRHVERIVSTHPLICHYQTQAQEDIAGVLEEMARIPVDVIAINGGDGTIAAVFTHLLPHSPFEFIPPVALLPGGTTNMNAGDVGMQGNLIKSVKRLCAWTEHHYNNWHLVRRPVLRVEPGWLRPAVYGMFFGIGAIIQGIEYCHDRIHTRGLRDGIGPGLTLLRMIWGLVRRDPRFNRAVHASLALNDTPATQSEDILLLLVSSLERLFLGMRPYWGSETGPLHVSLIRHHPERFLRTFPALLRGRPSRHATAAAGYRSHNVERICISMDGIFTLDGEMYPVNTTTGPVVISKGGEVTFLRF